MSEEKLSSQEVPQKFSEWLLAMGCPSEKVPGVDKLAEICRGQYYMVWRSLMEKVEAKDVIKNKRLQVFCDDMRKCQNKNVLEPENSIVPEEMLLWQHHTDLKKKVTNAENHLFCEKENLRQLNEYATNKLIQHTLLHKTLEDTQRRAYFLQQLVEQLKEKKSKILETKTIAESLCGKDEDPDVENNVNKCISSLKNHLSCTKSAGSLSLAANPAACSTAASNTSDHNDDELLSSVSRCRGEVLYKQLLEQRAGLCSQVPTTQPDSTQFTKKVQSVLCHSAALQSTVSIEAMRNRAHIERTKEKIARTFIELNNYLSAEESELLVTRCERACCEARVKSLTASVREIFASTGVFALGATKNLTSPGSHANLQTIDKAIVSKLNELKKIMSTVTVVEKKTQNAKERLVALFSELHDNSMQLNDRSEGRSSYSLESISLLRQFYEEKREKQRNKVELSMDLDMSESITFDETNDGSPTFINELKLYLNKFSIEKNRTLVLESGDKIWMFESIAASLRDIQNKLQNDDITNSMFCPTYTLESNLKKLTEKINSKKEMEIVIQELDSWKLERKEIDTSQAISEEQSIMDRVKKRLHENIQTLEKTNKNLDSGIEILQFWGDNNMKKYISDNRKINGISYDCYEKAYLQSLMY